MPLTDIFTLQLILLEIFYVLRLTNFWPNSLRSFTLKPIYVFSYNVVYLCDAIKSHAESIKAKYGLNCTVLGEDEFDVAFNDPELTALIIGTPTDTHEALCIRALEANKHVLCEKPLAMTIQSSIRVINLAKSKNLTLLVAFNRRFDPQMRHVADQVQEGKIGEVHTIKTVARDSPRPPTSYLKISGGIFHDCAVHDLGSLEIPTKNKQFNLES